MNIVDEIVKHVENNTSRLYYMIDGTLVVSVISFVPHDNGSVTVLEWKSVRKSSISVQYPKYYLHFDSKAKLTSALSVEAHRCLLGLDTCTLSGVPKVFLDNECNELIKNNTLPFMWAQHTELVVHQY